MQKINKRREQGRTDEQLRKVRRELAPGTSAAGVHRPFLQDVGDPVPFRLFPCWNHKSPWESAVRFIVAQEPIPVSVRTEEGTWSCRTEATTRIIRDYSQRRQRHANQAASQSASTTQPERRVWCHRPRTCQRWKRAEMKVQSPVAEPPSYSALLLLCSPVTRVYDAVTRWPGDWETLQRRRGRQVRTVTPGQSLAARVHRMPLN